MTRSHLLDSWRKRFFLIEVSSMTGYPEVRFCESTRVVFHCLVLLGLGVYLDKHQTLESTETNCVSSLISLQLAVTLVPFDEKLEF